MSRSSLCIAAWVLLAALFTACSTVPPVADRVASGVSEARLRADVERLTAIGSMVSVQRVGKRRILLPGRIDAQAEKIAYIRAQLEPLGYDVELEMFDLPERFRVKPGLKGINVIATKRGLAQPERIIELGCHHDTIGVPGADDNSSGVAGALEVARALADLPLQKTVRICFFDIEEGGMIGSAEHVRRIASEHDRFDGILVFEMIGYAVSGENTQRTPLRVPLLFSPPTVGDFIAVLGDIRSGSLARRFERAADRGAPPLKYYGVNSLAGFIKDAARSDQVPYWEAKLPGVMLTDTANFRNPNYHRDSDTVETLNFRFMSQVVRAAIVCLVADASAN